MRLLLLLLPFLFLVPSCKEEVHPQTQPKLVAVDSVPIIYNMINGKIKQEQLDTFFSHRFVDGTFSGCVLVAQHGVVLYKKAFGWKDHERRDSLNIDCAFQLASVSKQFTAAAIMLLHQEGKLNYDDTVSKYIPGFRWHGVTIRHLLTHRGGLDKYTNICDNYFRDRKLDEPQTFTNMEALALMDSLNVCACRQPGEKFDYSNTGYVVLAAVVEQISKQPFAAFMQQHIFSPVGMKHTWIATDGKQHDEKTKGYFGKWRWWEDNFLDGVTGDKGVYASVGDLFLWDRALHNGTILKPQTLKEAFTGQSPELNGKRPWNYGFGWRTITFDDGATAVFHNGWWHGYTTTFYRGLSDDVTVIILCNKFNRGIYNTRPVLAILGAHHLPMEDEAESAEAPDNQQAGGNTGAKKKK